MFQRSKALDKEYMVQSGAKAKPAQEEDELDEVEELRKSGFLGEGDGSSTLLKVPLSNH